MTDKAPRAEDEFGRLSEDQQDELEMLRGLAELDRRGSHRATEMLITLRRFSFLFTTALEELQETDEVAYLRALILIRRDSQVFLDDLNTVMQYDDPGATHLDANIVIEDAESLFFTSEIFTNGGHAVRSELIGLFRNNPHAKKAVAVLERLQELLPPDSAEA